MLVMQAIKEYEIYHANMITRSSFSQIQIQISLTYSSNRIPKNSGLFYDFLSDDEVIQNIRRIFYIFMSKLN